MENRRWLAVPFYAARVMPKRGSLPDMALNQPSCRTQQPPIMWASSVLTTMAIRRLRGEPSSLMNRRPLTAILPMTCTATYTLENSLKLRQRLSGSTNTTVALAQLAMMHVVSPLVMACSKVYSLPIRSRVFMTQIRAWREHGCFSYTIRTTPTTASSASPV